MYNGNVTGYKLSYPFYRFDMTNCTAHDGVMDANFTCYYKNSTATDEFLRIKDLKIGSKSASDEYFQ